MAQERQFSRLWRSLGATCLLLLAACDRAPKSGYGFALPDGDKAAGEAAFLRLHCTDCHSVYGREDLRSGVDPAMTVPLGGPKARISTYGELVTSIINPSHRISQKYLGSSVQRNSASAMRNYNDVMTVSELIDLVAFLQEQYRLEPWSGPSYQSERRR